MVYEIAKLGVSGMINDLVIKETMSFVDDKAAREWALAINQRQNETNLTSCRYVVVSVSRDGNYVYI